MFCNNGLCQNYNSKKKEGKKKEKENTLLPYAVTFESKHFCKEVQVSSG